MPSKSLERYYWLKEHGICTRCGVEKADKGYTSCLVCRMDMREYAENYRNKNKEKLSQKRKKSDKIRRENRRSKNLCRICGKRSADEGYTSCKYCRAKARLYEKNRRIEKGLNTRELLDDYTRCSICGSTDLVEGKKLCRKHYEIAKQNMLNARAHRKDSPNYFESSIKAHWESRSVKGGDKNE